MLHTLAVRRSVDRAAHAAEQRRRGVGMQVAQHLQQRRRASKSNATCRARCSVCTSYVIISTDIMLNISPRSSTQWYRLVYLAYVKMQAPPGDYAPGCAEQFGIGEA